MREEMFHNSITAHYLLCVWTLFFFIAEASVFRTSQFAATIAAEGILSHSNPFGSESPSFHLK